MYPNTNMQLPHFTPRQGGLTTPLPAGGSMMGLHSPSHATQAASMPHDYATQRLFRQLAGGGHSTMVHGGAQDRALSAAMHASGIHGRDAVNLRHTLQAMSRGEGLPMGGMGTGSVHAPASIPHSVSRPTITMPRPHF